LKGGEILKYRKLIGSALLGLGMATINHSNVKADYFTDYNTTVTDTVFRENIFNFDIFNYFLIFYSLDSNNILNELFRLPLKKSGNGKIVDKSLLKLFAPNTRIIMNVMTYDIDNNGSIKNLEYSKSSKIYFTKKNINLIVSEGNKEVVNRNIELRNIPQEDKIAVYPYEIEQYYNPDKYYSYRKAVILIDGKESNSENIELPYLAKKIEVKLAQDKDYWNKVTVEYPSELKKDNKEYLIKQGTTFSSFVKENDIKEITSKDAKYEFSGFYLDDKEIVSSQVLGNNIKIQAKYNTKVVLDNGSSKKEVTLLTGQKLSEIDTKFFSKEKYHVESYSIYNASDNSKIKDVKDLSEEKVDNSIIIKANYKENVNTLKIRQDDYNKRFGKVDESIRDKDIEWPETKKIGELLSELRKKIKPSTGYEVLFRSNKKVINDDEYINSETIIEIYFKKVESEWVNVKFVGRGIAEVVSSPVIYTGFSTAFWNKMEQFNLFKDLTEAKKTELKNNLINDNGWQTFSYPPSFTQNNWVYIVKTADGKAAKIQLTSYNHSTKNTTGFITFKYQVANSNNKF